MPGINNKSDQKKGAAGNRSDTLSEVCWPSALQLPRRSDFLKPYNEIVSFAAVLV